MTSYRDPLKGTWDQTQRPTQRNMGPDTETRSKEHGTRHRDPLKGTWNQTETRSKEHGTRHPDSDIIQRPAQRNMGPDTETHSKRTWDTETRSKNMGRDIQTVTS